MTDLKVGGLTRLSSCDWPGELVATVFCQGCPWRCDYCHNPHLLAPRGDQEMPWADVLAFLECRRGLLDGVVFSGGEPTLQVALGDAIEQVRSLGFRVGLHTGGPFPDRLERVLPRLDWVGLDIKAPFDAYERVTHVAASGEAARASLRHLLASGVDYEVRTTVDPALLRGEDLIRLAGDLSRLGVGTYVLQHARAPGRPLPPSAAGEAWAALDLPDEYQGAFGSFSIR